MQLSLKFSSLIAAMCMIVVASNYLVQFPFEYQLAQVNLADLLTWGAFTYPVAFLVTDLSNRRYGPQGARIIVFIGFVLAVFLSVYLATPRIAIASGSAFLIAQLLDVSIFDRLRNSTWWRAPLISTVLGSTVDTVLFFSLAFAPIFSIFGPNDDFAIANAPLLGLFALEIPRWISWAVGDYWVKLLVGAAMLLPYGMLLSLFSNRNTAKTA